MTVQRHFTERQLTTLSPRVGNGDLNRPALPADLLVSSREPCLAPPLLEELDVDLAPRTIRRRRIELAFERRSAGVNHGLKLIVVDVRQSKVEDVARAWCQRGEEAIKEDGVEDGFDDFSDGARVCEGFQEEFGRWCCVHGGGGERGKLARDVGGWNHRMGVALVYYARFGYRQVVGVSGAYNCEFDEADGRQNAGDVTLNRRL